MSGDHHGGDPPRLLDSAGDVPEELLALLRGAEADLLEPERVERVAATMAAGGAGAGLAASGKTIFGLKLGQALTVGLAAIGLSVGGAWLIGGNAAPPEDVPVEVAQQSATDLQAEATSARDEVAAAATDSSPSPAPEPSEADEKALAPVPAVAKPAQAPAAEETKVAAKTERRRQAIAEHRLLKAARAALDENPSRALALTQEHRQKFPSGMLSQEREVIAIDALARLGRTKAARDKAEGFEKDYPDSVHKGRVEDSVKRGK